MSTIRTASICNANSAPAASCVMPATTNPHSLTLSDVAALEALAPTLQGGWQCEAEFDDEGHVWAVLERRIERQDCFVPRLDRFLVTRQGSRVRLVDTASWQARDYTSTEALSAALGTLIGRRRAD